MMNSASRATVEHACVDTWGPSVRRQAARLGLTVEEVDELLALAGRRGVEEVERQLMECGDPQPAAFTVYIDPEGIRLGEPGSEVAL